MQRLTAPLADREEQHEPRQHDRDRKRHDRAQRVRVVGTRKLDAAMFETSGEA